MSRKTGFLLTFALASSLSVLPAHSTICGSGYFNHPVDWPGSPDLYFSVAGAPANSCGDLWAQRNGGAYTLEASCWLTTNSLGQATMGPWNVSTHTSDETAYAYIDFGSCNTQAAKHVFDVTAPTAAITSGGPSAFSGTASDGPYGAGFDGSWYACYTAYFDDSAQLFWSSSLGTYSRPGADYVPCSVSGMPSVSVSWSAAQIPATHTPTHHYTWTVWVYDGAQWGWTTAGFTY